MLRMAVRRAIGRGVDSARYRKRAWVLIGDMIRRAAQRFGDAPAITCDKRTLSFADFDSATDKLGNALLDTGLLPGLLRCREIRSRAGISQCARHPPRSRVPDTGRRVPSGDR